MTTDHGETNGVSVTSFFGGAGRGRMVQLTIPTGAYVELTPMEASELGLRLKLAGLGKEPEATE